MTEFENKENTKEKRGNALLSEKDRAGHVCGCIN